MTRGQAAGLVVLAALWGASFLFIDIAVEPLGALAVADARVVLSVATLALYGVLTQRRIAPEAAVRDLALVGVVNVALPFALISAALLTIPPSLAAIVNSTAPFFSAVIAALVLDHRMPARVAAGLALGVAGVALVVGLAPIDLDGAALLAIGASTLAAACYAAGGHLTSRRLGTVPPLANAVGQQLAAAVVLTPVLLAGPPREAPGTGAVLAVVTLAVACTAVAYLIYFRLIAEVGATSALTVTYLVPVFGVLWAAIFRGDRITAGMVAGTAVVLAGVALVTGTTPRRRESVRRPA